MTADLTTTSAAGPLADRFRVQAFLSAILVMAGALFATFLVLAALVVSLPLTLAASMTAQGKSGRRGWTELEPAEA